MGADQADFGFGDLPAGHRTLPGDPVVALVAVNQEEPLSLCTLKDKHVLTSVADLEGCGSASRRAVPRTSSSRPSWPRTASTGPRSPELPVTPPYENYLLQGRWTSSCVTSTPRCRSCGPRRRTAGGRSCAARTWL
ncbi:MAG: hypothetical protein R3C32_14780 [Chloroflexota bacterium]